MKRLLYLITVSVVIILCTRYGLLLGDSLLTGYIEADYATIDVERIDADGIYLLENFEHQIVLVSPSKRPMEIQMINQMSKYTIQKNNEIVLQNYNKFARGYHDSPNAIFSIHSKDYDDNNRCIIKLQRTESLANKHSRFYLGGYRKLFRF